MSNRLIDIVVFVEVSVFVSSSLVFMERMFRWSFFFVDASRGRVRVGWKSSCFFWAVVRNEIK